MDLKLSQSGFRGSRWWTRGWTLQELLAPSKVVFFVDVDVDEESAPNGTMGRSYANDDSIESLAHPEVARLAAQYSRKWRSIGTKTELSYLIASTTGIDVEILNGPDFLQITSVAQRMSWASSRVTSRPEDMAYCLMALFDVHMPLLYGEGAERAFLRLQEQIMAFSDDQSLFAWKDEDASPETRYGLLATHPRFFHNCNLIVPYQDWQCRPPYQLTNRGLQIDLPLLPKTGVYDWSSKEVRFIEKDTFTEYATFTAALDCPVPPGYEDGSFLAIHLEKLPGSDMQFARVMASQIGCLQSPLQKLKKIYVRQSQKQSNARESGLFPRQVLQMSRAMFSVGNYRAIEVVAPEFTPIWGMDQLHWQREAKKWLPFNFQNSFQISKGPRAQVAAAILFEREEDGERLFVRIGSAGRAKVGFDAVRQLPKPPAGPEYDNDQLRRQARDTFVPRQSGQSVELKYHRVQVIFAEPFVVGGSKFIPVDVEIEAVSFAEITQ